MAETGVLQGADGVSLGEFLRWDSALDAYDSGGFA